MSKENHVPYFVTTPPPNFRKNNDNTMKIGVNINTPSYNVKTTLPYNAGANISRNPNIIPNQNVRNLVGGTYVRNSPSTRLNIAPSQNDNARSSKTMLSPTGYSSYEMENERLQSPQQDFKQPSGLGQHTRKPTGPLNTSRSSMQSSMPMDITPHYKAASPVATQQHSLRSLPGSTNQQNRRPLTGQNQSPQSQYDSPTSGTQSSRYYSMEMSPPVVPSSYMPNPYTKLGVQSQSSPTIPEHNVPSYSPTSSMYMSPQASTSTERGVDMKVVTYAGSAPMDMYYDNRASYYNRSAVMQPPLPEQPPPSKPPPPTERPPPDPNDSKPQHIDHSSYTNGSVYYPSPSIPYTNVPPPTQYQSPMHCAPPTPQSYTPAYQPAVPVQNSYVPRSNYYKRRLDDCDSQRKNNKKKKKPLSQNVSHRKDWSVADAKRAIDVEKECNKRARSQSLIIKFPDLELNRDIVSQFHRSIEGVHFQQPSTPRFCFVTLASTADPEEVIKDLNRVKFGHGYLTAEFKKDREDDLNLGPEDIDPLTLYVGNLAQEVTKEDMVRTYPKTKRIDIGYAKKMKYTRYAFVSFKSVDDAIEAFRKTHSTQMHSKSLIVRFRRLHGTVGMPGEPKPQNPQKPLENQTRSNSFSDDTDESGVRQAPWNMVDVSSWQADVRGRVKEEPLKILSDDEEGFEDIYEEDNDLETDEIPEVKPKLEMDTPFLPGSLEVAFSMHKPLQISNVKREIVVEDNSNDYSQQNSGIYERVNNFNCVDSPPDTRPSLPLILDESAQNKEYSEANATSLDKNIGSCETPNPTTAEDSVSRQTSDKERVPVPRPIIDQKPLLDPVSGTVLRIKEEVPDTISTTTVYNQLVMLEHRMRNSYYPIEDVKEEPIEETKDEEETRTECLGLNYEKETHPSETVNNDMATDNNRTTKTDNNTNLNLDIEHAKEILISGDETRVLPIEKNAPPVDDHVQNISAIPDEVELQSEVKREPCDDSDANDSDDSDSTDFDDIISRMNEKKSKED